MRKLNTKSKLAALAAMAVIGIAAILTFNHAALGMSATTQAAPGQKSEKQERTIEGVWRTVVTPRNCLTGLEVAPSFPGLFTFNKGGTVSEYGISPGLTPALRSPGHGIWQHEEGWQLYSLKFTFYRYNASGAFIGSQKITAALELGADGDSFTTNSAIEVLDANDNVVGNGCATAVGTRFE
jgi:hypothetical protein